MHINFWMPRTCHPVGIPSNLLERRPEIAAPNATWPLPTPQSHRHRRPYYPNLTRSAQGGFEKFRAASLMTWPSRFWYVGPSISETIFDAGPPPRHREQFVAVYTADVAPMSTGLIAFQQVEDTWLRFASIQTDSADRNKAVASAQQFLALSQAR